METYKHFSQIQIIEDKEQFDAEFVGGHGKLACHPKRSDGS